MPKVFGPPEVPGPHERGTVVSHDGTKISYDKYGSTEAPQKVVFVMGLMATGDAWYFQLCHFAQRPDLYETICFDNRGVGASDAPCGRYTTSSMAKDVLALLDHLGWQRAHLVGVSMGGMISLEFAHAFGERVASLSLVVTQAGGVSAWPGPTQVMALRTIAKFSASRDASAVVHGLMNILYSQQWLDAPRSEAERAFDNPDLGARRTNREVMADYHFFRVKKHGKPREAGRKGQGGAVMTHYLSGARLATIRDLGVPILILGATDDKIIASRCSDVLHSYLKAEHVTYMVFEAGHGLTAERHIAVNEALGATFERAAAGGGNAK